MTSEIKNILISPEWLAERVGSAAGSADVGDFIVVDTRGPGEYAAGHIPGAVNLPSGTLYDPQTPSSDLLPPDIVERRVAEARIDADSQLIFYDDSGLVPSARVFWALENYGRSNMSLLDGGFLGWMTRKLAVERGERPVDGARGTPFRARGEGLAYASRDDVLAAMEDPNTVIIDTRTEDEYWGRTAAHKRNGHIPGAKNVDWQNHIQDLFDPTLKAPGELWKLYRAVGLDESKRVIVYCRTGSRSSHTYFVLRYLGFTDVRNYKRSWMEWNVDESVPVER